MNTLKPLQLKPLILKPLGIKSPAARSPLDDIPIKGDVEVDAKEELNALQQGFQERRKREADRFRLSTDSEHWTCICFSSREQKEHFLKALDLLAIGDKYLDGYKVAEKFGVTLPEVKF